MRAYRTPEGKVDVPYAYVYDAKDLTDGQNYQRLAINLDHNSEFILRRVVGANLCVNSNATGKFLGRYFDASQFSQAAIRPGLLLDGTTRSGFIPILPEAVYPKGGQLSFDLLGLLRNSTADTPTIYNSQIAFCGMRRFDEGNFFFYKTPYEYRENPYVYTYDLNLTWAHWTDGVNGVPTNPRTFGVKVLEHDFELCAIGVVQRSGALVTTNDFQISLWDASKSQQFSSAPMNIPFVNYNAPAQYGRPVFPVPPIVYPIKGQIFFDIVSMLPFGSTGNYRIHFMGIRRMAK